MNKGKLFTCGNGGSAADAQHMAAEFIGKLDKFMRPAIPCICFNTNVSIITALSNDYGYENVFLRQLEALASQGDVLMTISTSGNSANLVEVAKFARQNNIKTIALTGNNGGKLKPIVDICINVPAKESFFIQNIHIIIIHIMCFLIEKEIYYHIQLN